MYNIIKRVDNLVNLDTASAHCDIPCKIYDPIISQISALSIVRLIDIINEVPAGSNDIGSINTITRCVLRKEEEAAKVKQEVRVIWGDYFKTPQFEKYPDMHELTHQIMMTASSCKQSVSREVGEELVNLVNQFSAAFWDTKGISVEKKVCPYPPSLEIVYPII
tara:strand:- start:44 stop:535 length:492 start_codon:yes stop_codon:yes gene_type:complete